MSANRVIGVDLGGTKILAGIIDADGTVHETVERPTVTTSQDALLDELAETVRSLPQEGVAAVGFGIPSRIDHVNGTVLGAVNIPFTDILDENLMYNRDRVEKLFAAAGIKPNDTVVAYCHIGLQATTVVFGARLTGRKAVMYDGAFEDWAKNSRGPVEK